MWRSLFIGLFLTGCTLPNTQCEMNSYYVRVDGHGQYAVQETVECKNADSDPRL
jgi:hypothetical protein